MKLHFLLILEFINKTNLSGEDPSVIRTPDGSIEFGRKIKLENLVIKLYHIQDSYSYDTLLKDHNLILKKINDVLIINDLEEIKYFTVAFPKNRTVYNSNLLISNFNCYYENKQIYGESNNKGSKGK